MAGFRRDKPIDPMHEAGICRWLAEHHERMAAETEGWDHDDHVKAAKACRDRAEEWEAKAAAQSAPARPAAAPKVEAAPCKPSPVVSHAAPKPQHKPAPVATAKPARPAQPKPAMADGAQGALF